MERQMTEREPRADEPSGPEDGPIIEKWHGLVDTVRDATKHAFPASPPSDASSPSTFQTYWRAVFTRLRQEVSANPDIPLHLTAPPTTKFTVTLFDEIHGLCCPCGHPDVKPNIILENKDGVTKEELIDGFINCMYGEALPAVYIEPAPPVQEDHEETSDENEGYDMDSTAEKEGPALVYSSAWLSSGTDENGETVAYASEPNIVFYCCRPEEYATKREDEDGARDIEMKAVELESKAKL